MRRQIGRRTQRREIAARLRAARIERGVTQQEAAKVARISRDTWNRIELGRAAIPAERVIEFAEIVGVDVAVLLGEA